MIKHLIDLLNTNDYYGVSKNIDIAKGKYAIPYNWKDGLKQIKRIWYG
jgi:hypothetical protein